MNAEPGISPNGNVYIFSSAPSAPNAATSRAVVSSYAATKSPEASSASRRRLAREPGHEEPVSAGDVVDQVPDLPRLARRRIVELVGLHIAQDVAGGGDGLFEGLRAHGSVSLVWPVSRTERTPLFGGVLAYSHSIVPGGFDVMSYLSGGSAPTTPAHPARWRSHG